MAGIVEKSLHPVPKFSPQTIARSFSSVSGASWCKFTQTQRLFLLREIDIFFILNSGERRAACHIIILWIAWIFSSTVWPNTTQDTAILFPVILLFSFYFNLQKTLKTSHLITDIYIAPLIISIQSFEGLTMATKTPGFIALPKPTGNFFLHLASTTIFVSVISDLVGAGSIWSSWLDWGLMWIWIRASDWWIRVDLRLIWLLEPQIYT